MKIMKCKMHAVGVVELVKVFCASLITVFFRKSTRRLLTPCSSPRNLWRFFTNFVPILQWLPKYDWKSDITHDIIGGLTIGVMHVPQGLFFYQILSKILSKMKFKLLH